jgi:hypothetical protein
VSACGVGYGNSGYGGPVNGGPPPDAGAGGTGATLTVKNYLGWCAVSINGGAPSTSAVVTAAVTPGTNATVVATPLAGFEIGPTPWFGTDENGGAAAAGNDVGAGAGETSTAVVSIGEAGLPKCVSVCCQQPGNSPDPCPSTTPCR